MRFFGLICSLSFAALACDRPALAASCPAAIEASGNRSAALTIADGPFARLLLETVSAAPSGMGNARFLLPQSYVPDVPTPGYSPSNLPPFAFSTMVEGHRIEATFMRNDGTDELIPLGPHIAPNTPRFGIGIRMLSPEGRTEDLAMLRWSRSRSTELGRTIRFERSAVVGGRSGTIVMLLNQRTFGRTRPVEGTVVAGLPIWTTDRAAIRFILGTSAQDASFD